MSKLSLKSTLSESWHRVKGTKLPVLWLVIALFIIGVVSGFISGHIPFNPDHPPHAGRELLGNLVHALLAAPMVAGICMIGISRANNQAIPMWFGFKFFNKTLGIFFTTVLTTLIAIVASMIFMLIGAFAATISPWLMNVVLVIMLIIMLCIGALFLLAPFYVAEKGLLPWVAIWRSVKMIWPHLPKVFLLLIILTLINAIGALLLLVGLLWTIPWSVITTGMIYRELN